MDYLQTFLVVLVYSMISVSPLAKVPPIEIMACPVH